MGDFNDEPFNRSLVEHALSERVERRVKSLRSGNPYLLSLKWNQIGQAFAVTTTMERQISSTNS